MTAALKTSQQGQTKLLFATGDWQLAAASSLDTQLAEVLHEVKAGGATSARLVLDQLHSLDTAGAWLLVRTIDRFQSAGVDTVLVGAKPHHAALLARLEAGHPEPIRDDRMPGWLRIIVHLGEVTCRIGAEALRFLSFFGAVCIAFLDGLVRPHRVRWNAVSHHLEDTGINALPIVALLAFLIGAVLAFQGSTQLALFGAEVFTTDLLGVSVTRELGVLLTAIIVAGRSGSAFTAQIGTMQINQETDAMRVIGLDPIRVLVLPRVAALVLAVPILSIVAMLMAFIGGAMVVVFGLDIPTIQFIRQLRAAVSFEIFLAGIIKAPVFAFIIATAGCYKGLSVSGSADSVGRLTTESVVVSIFLVIVVDAIFSVVFASMGI